MDGLRCFIVGLGYVGRRVAAAEIASGSKVGALVRTRPAACAALPDISVVEADLDAPDSLAAVTDVGQCVYYFAPPPSVGVTDPRLTAFLARLERIPPPGRLVLISTTGVYGDCAGAWVDETRPAQPYADRAKRRRDAESTLARWCALRSVTPVILRVPGIYGPDRLPLARLRSGDPVLAPEESPYSNRIHVDDLVRTCLAAARRSAPEPIYNVSDGYPSTMTDYFYRAADALSMPRPPVVSRHGADDALSPGMLSYLRESKRIENRLMREHLLVEPRFTDLDAGLEDAVRRSKSLKVSAPRDGTATVGRNVS